jgi:hypothetical protein
MMARWWKFWDPDSGFIGGLIFVGLLILGTVGTVAGALCLNLN